MRTPRAVRHAGPAWRATALAVLVALLALVPAHRVPARPADVESIRSVVVLGDSVAAGEGADSGHRYRDRAVLPGWTRGSSSPDRCGRSDAAYGTLVGRALGATVTNLACTGATIDDVASLDARYDRAAPDLVLVTAGANSFAFERVFAYCVLASNGVSERDAARIASARTVSGAIARALRAAVDDTLDRAPAPGPPACTRDHPGAYLEATVLERADAVALAARAVATEVRARGRSLGRIPEVVFAAYPDPLPRRPAGLLACPDAAGLGAAQLAYLRDLVADLTGTVRDALAGLPGVVVADPDPAFAGHRWCDPDPWVYGPSILATDPTSRAPFHPTPEGHRAIAEAVLAARTDLVSGVS